MVTAISPPGLEPGPLGLAYLVLKINEFSNCGEMFHYKDFKVPFFCDMDCKVTGKLPMQFICELENVELEIMATTCDHVGSNYGFNATLEMTEDDSWVQNPVDQNPLSSSTLIGCMFIKFSTIISWITPLYLNME